ncbi:MAG: hypothetical protein BAJATHORv1_30432 [Candidatus Thorarchaeota archaeon]|nr:MAG: hypothetical protein BAJATHORv1_30432 [Candidatus Thorarchaeota archaeon]
MPEGLAVLKWDDELGPVVTSKTPKSLQIGLDPTTSMRVYGIATLGETEESQKPGFNSLAFDEFKLAVYYGGLNMHLKGQPSMVFLVLGPDEDPDVYKDALPEMATQIFLNLEDDEYVKMVPKLYKQISRYTQMTPEQRQASILSDPVRRSLLQTLIRNGTVQNADLEQMIFEEVGKKIDVDMVLRPLVKMGIIATGWVEGLASEVVYLTRAILILRKTPVETLRKVQAGKIPTTVAKQFLETTKRYHREYVAKLRKDLSETIWAEAEELAKYLLDFQVYDLLQILRAGPQVGEDLLGMLDITQGSLRKLLKELEKAGIVITVNDEEGRQHVLLKSSPEVITVYPEWLIDRTVTLYNTEEIPSRQALHYLEVLRQFHPSQATKMVAGVE